MLISNGKDLMFVSAGKVKIFFIPGENVSTFKTMFINKINAKCASNNIYVKFNALDMQTD